MRQRQQRLARNALEPRQRFARLVAERVGYFFSEAHDPTVSNFRIELKTMRDRCRHEYYRCCCKAGGRCLKTEFTAAFFDQQDLEQIAVAMRPDCPVMDRGARGNGLDMDKVKYGIV